MKLLARFLFNAALSPLLYAIAGWVLLAHCWQHRKTQPGPLIKT